MESEISAADHVATLAAALDIANAYQKKKKMKKKQQKQKITISPSPERNESVAYRGYLA